MKLVMSLAGIALAICAPTLATAQPVTATSFHSSMMYGAQSGGHTISTSVLTFASGSSFGSSTTFTDPITNAPFDPAVLGFYSGTISQTIDFKSASSILVASKVSADLNPPVSGILDHSIGSLFFAYSFSSAMPFYFSAKESIVGGNFLSMSDSYQNSYLSSFGPGGFFENGAWDGVLIPAGSYGFQHAAGGSNHFSYFFEGEGTRTVEINIAAVPEPASWAMMIGGFGVVGLAARRGRRRKAALA